MRHLLILAILLAALWLLLSGHLEALLLVLGALSISFVLWLSHRMDVVDEESYPVFLTPRLMIYAFWLLWEIIKSNLDVAKRALGPSRAVRPVVFDTRASQHTDLGLVVHANSITLTPGTVSLEVVPGRISVHALHPDIAAGLEDGGMDERVPDNWEET